MAQIFLSTICSLNHLPCCWCDVEGGSDASDEDALEEDIEPKEKPKPKIKAKAKAKAKNKKAGKK